MTYYLGAPLIFWLKASSEKFPWRSDCHYHRSKYRPALHSSYLPQRLRLYLKDGKKGFSGVEGLAGNHSSASSYTTQKIWCLLLNSIQQSDLSGTDMSHVSQVPSSIISSSSISILPYSLHSQSVSSYLVLVSPKKKAPELVQAPDSVSEFHPTVTPSPINSCLDYSPFSKSASQVSLDDPSESAAAAYTMITEVPESESSTNIISAPKPEVIPIHLQTKKKYKPVAIKTKPILGEVSEKFRIIWDIKGDPLANMPVLNPHPPKFTPCGQYTQEHKELFDKANEGFLWPDKCHPLHHFMMLHQDAFAWDDSKQGHFRKDLFLPVDIPVVPHKPWVQHNIPIPPGIYDDVCKLIKRKIDARVFEPSNSSYCSHWFCVAKKDGKSLHIIQSLEPLNKVTIQHSGVPPFTEQLTEHFARQACGSMMDLFVGYDKRALAELSRDYTTFQTPFGTLRLTTLPMGWTNLVPIFHGNVTHILQEEIPHVTQPYIDDVGVQGPASKYTLPNGEHETIPENPGIRCFVWEHFQDFNRVAQRMKYCGGTFSGLKSFLVRPEITVFDHRCTIDGHLPDPIWVEKIVNWGPCCDLSDVQAFLGILGICRLFIKDFAKRAHHLVKLTRKGVEWEFSQDQLDAMKDLKETFLSSPALKPIDYKSEVPVILSVNTSSIVVGYILSQCDPNNTKLWYFAKFGPITLNKREGHYSQPKLKSYGLYRALWALKLYLLGVWNLIIEVDAINSWIVSILMFHFTLVHVPGTHHGSNGLSRCRPQEGDEEEPEEDFYDWVDQINGFMHFINLLPSHISYNSNTPLILCYITNTPWEDSPQIQDKDPPTPYSAVQWSEGAKAADLRLEKAQHWLEMLERPPSLSDSEFKSFICYCTKFFVSDGRLWHKNPTKGHHKVIVPQERCLFLISSAHDNIKHHRFYATNALLAEHTGGLQWAKI